MKDVVILKGCQQVSNADIMGLKTKLEQVISAYKYLREQIVSAPLAIKILLEDEKSALKNLEQLRRELNP